MAISQDEIIKFIAMLREEGNMYNKESKKEEKENFKYSLSVRALLCWDIADALEELNNEDA